ncbi:uncharacterized protein LOC62_07G009573 [Vanrija pseudolonga]|uniref:F-box domain-containing protein n=1 Tax=Vanrija pseudolonga TaxID=143232 RepID=A0AAF1BRP0_9TREE|nr:hypothetical protein LOC62_07G009573 [Vanrija pseudolonga]
MAEAAPGPDDPPVPAALLDSTAYPHILDHILTHTDWDTLLCFRRTSRSLRARVDNVLSHLVITSEDDAALVLSSSSGWRAERLLLPFPQGLGSYVGPVNIAPWSLENENEDDGPEPAGRRRRSSASRTIQLPRLLPSSNVPPGLVSLGASADFFEPRRPEHTVAQAGEVSRLRLLLAPASVVDLHGPVNDPLLSAFNPLASVPISARTVRLFPSPSGQHGSVSLCHARSVVLFGGAVLARNIFLSGAQRARAAGTYLPPTVLDLAPATRRLVLNFPFYRGYDHIHRGVKLQLSAVEHVTLIFSEAASDGEDGDDENAAAPHVPPMRWVVLVLLIVQVLEGASATVVNMRPLAHAWPDSDRFAPAPGEIEAALRAAVASYLRPQAARGLDVAAALGRLEILSMEEYAARTDRAQLALETEGQGEVGTVWWR